MDEFMYVHVYTRGTPTRHTQDLFHRLSTPSQRAGKRPRYSFVMKLLMFPKQESQRCSLQRKAWPAPLRFGSARRCKAGGSKRGKGNTRQGRTSEDSHANAVGVEDKEGKGDGDGHDASDMDGGHGNDAVKEKEKEMAEKTEKAKTNLQRSDDQRPRKRHGHRTTSRGGDDSSNNNNTANSVSGDNCTISGGNGNSGCKAGTNNGNDNDDRIDRVSTLNTSGESGGKSNSSDSSNLCIKVSSRGISLGDDAEDLNDVSPCRHRRKPDPRAPKRQRL